MLALLSRNPPFWDPKGKKCPFFSNNVAKTCQKQTEINTDGIFQNRNGQKMSKIVEDELNQNINKPKIQ